LLVEDAHSRNGTYVEEERIVDPVELAEGMVVGFSRSGPRYKLSQGRLQQSGQERGSPW
jgi:pSer/pThr/pTyr-binding forkhead associated (FHA) protein